MRAEITRTAGWDFPDRRAIDAMRRAGATHVVVHRRLFDEGETTRLMM